MILMKIIKKLIFKEKARRILNGVLDGIPVVSTVKKNIESAEGGVGNIDVLRLISTILTSVCLIILLIAVVKGSISIDELKQLITIITK
jgi:hypothetical protein